jgi:[methyl-Co(III) methanol-specific corrinoid protein]:coenzyme M methyltransferase
MDPIERLLRALSHQKVDRPPVTALMTAVTTEMMDSTGMRWPEAHHDPERMAKLAAAAFETCGLESVKLPFDMTVEAGALGAKVDYGTKNTLPQVREHLYRDPEEIIIGEDFLKQGRVPVVLEAIRWAKRMYGKEIPVVSSIVGPFTLSAMLVGFENLFYWMLVEPEKYVMALEMVTNLCITYAKEQFKAGSHVVQIGEASSSGDLISSDHFRRFVAPYQGKLCGAVEGPTVIHICGNITGHLEHIAGTGARGVSFDQKTGMQEALKHLKGRVALVGYVPTTLLLEGTPDEVFAFSKRCIESGVDVLNAGCAWPADTPNDNVKAMVRAATGVEH